MARDEATDEESRAEDKHDMRSQSAAYLAAGQAKLAGDTIEAIAAWRNLPLREFAPGEPAAAGALVIIQPDRGGPSLHYFLGPLGGGLEIRAAGSVVTVVTSGSPIGRLLFGARTGDRLALPGGPKPARFRVMGVG